MLRLSFTRVPRAMYRCGVCVNMWARPPATTRPRAEHHRPSALAVTHTASDPFAFWARSPESASSGRVAFDGVGFVAVGWGDGFAAGGCDGELVVIVTVCASELRIPSEA
jgi:hypothetical protein